MRLILAACVMVLALGACSRDSAPEAPAPLALGPAEQAELEALQALAAQVEADAAEVAGFEVLQARYAWEADPRTGNLQPTVHLALANGTALTVVQLSVQADFVRPGEPGPWHAQEFHMPLVGGLSPGAGSAVRMLPTADSDWALKAPPPEVEVIARVVPVALQTADGRKLLTAHAFGPARQARLARLQGGQP
ncbi:hypothetical protein [Arenimonas sp.]|uniref:hypothetical protein n=1 Tax=Arenimonas sp. TaxID=1872635 RepID=UPI0025E36D56|nr:hypothetical protein [Arenimonas sp.]